MASNVNAMMPNWNNAINHTQISQGSTYTIPTTGWYSIRIESTSGAAAEVYVYANNQSTAYCIARAYINDSDRRVANQVVLFFKAGVKIQTRSGQGYYIIAKIV